MPVPASFSYPGAAFFGGVRSALGSVFFPVLAGTYIGIGALAHDFAFSSWWLALSTLLVCAAPAQVILLSALGVGSAIFEAAVAVTLTGIRLFPMVVALLPLIRRKETPFYQLVLPTHFTSVSMWIESLLLLSGDSRRAPDRILQRSFDGLYGDCNDVRICRLLSGRQIAAAPCRRSPVSHSIVVFDFGGS